MRLEALAKTSTSTVLLQDTCTGSCNINNVAEEEREDGQVWEIARNKNVNAKLTDTANKNGFALIQRINQNVPDADVLRNGVN
jgi:hypothetical protein